MTLDGHQLNAILLAFGIKVATEVRDNQDIVNSLKKLTNEADGFNFTVKEKLGDFVYVRLDEIVSNIKKLLENRKK